MRRKIRILYERYLNAEGDRLVGGIESYIDALCSVCLEYGLDPSVYYYSNQEKFITINGYNTYGVKNATNARHLLQHIAKKEKPNYDEDILIFATDLMIVPNQYKKAIAIQHGIAWDITSDEKKSSFYNILTIFKGSFRAIRKFQRYLNCGNIVCVDYNFINWYRTQVAHVDLNLFFIPNFTRCNLKDNCGRKQRKNGIEIVFARRFVEYRGTKLFASAIIDITKRYPEVHFTIAGDGPDEQWLHQKLDSYNTVSFTKFKTEDSIDFHSQFDIAVVPTKGSEGTSLSLLEAMSAGCAVIATNVGGMTNIILDEYNGLLISPCITELEDAIVRLIEDEKLRDYLSRKAQETVQRSFSYEKWKKSWINVIRSIEKQ